MISGTLASLIKEKVNYSRLLIFIFTVGIIGVGFQLVEEYTMFYILFPVLLIMLVSVILILHFCLKELQKFQENCNDNAVKECCRFLFPKKSNPLLLSIYTIMVITYFVCVYCLDFVKINLMGMYIFLLGGGTFLLALISYEVYVRLTISLKETVKNIANISYNEIYPKDTLWLQYFFRLHKVLKNSALIISILFVLENSMFFIANREKLFFPNLSDADGILDFLKGIQIEWCIIWLYIFVTIVLALPFMTWLQNKSLNNIISYIQTDFNKKITISYTWIYLQQYPQNYYSILNIIQTIQNTLDEAYLPRRIDRFVSICASLLTCFAHLSSFCMILIPGFFSSLTQSQV